MYVWGVREVESGGRSAGARARPQPPQNFSPGSFENPQEEQGRANGAPHSAQKRRPSRFWARQRGHCMPWPPLGYMGEKKSPSTAIVLLDTSLRLGCQSALAAGHGG